MRALHDSRGSRYRSPYGAVPQGGAVTLTVDVWDDPGTQATIRTWVDGEGESFFPMELVDVAEDGRLTFTGEVPAAEPGIVWYAFLLQGSDGRVRYYGAREGRTGGVGQMYDSMPPSFQVTVYVPRQITPDWYKGGMVYQIFPDRYKRGADWRERVEASLSRDRADGVPRAVVKDWDTPPDYRRDSSGRVSVWEFYGGTLEGIREELGHIREMGFTALYLNPIFEAQSNHRYDTADYLSVDPMLGDEEGFRRLCADAAELGMSVILDGVFNHTGVDSVYFNKYGNYPTVGAWQSPESPYRPWYLMHEDGTYTCWWGVDDLPDTDKANPEWQRFVYGPDGVVEHWLRAGARGWRLDVADELNDAFIAGIKAAEDRVLPDALLLGEVWEDASNKVAYGEMRHYLCGTELDSAMNYPFREALLSYLLGTWPAEEMVERMASIKENYPPDAFYATLNLLGSHDRTRLLTILGGAPDAGSLTDEQRRDYRLTDGQRGLAKGRLWLAALVQMCSPGVPCVYYGDEAGVEGYTDPYNRSTYPWGHEDADCKTIYRNAMALREQFPMLVNGGFEPFSVGPDVYGFWRTPAAGDDETGERICVLVNRSLSDVHEVRLPAVAPCVDDLVSGVAPAREADEVVVRLAQLGSAVLYFHGQSPLVKPFERGLGIVCHVTSLPREDGHGTLGPEAYSFVDWLERCHQGYWQVLPVNPTDGFGSPYAGPSAFAGNTRLVDTCGKTLEELFSAWEAEGARGLPVGLAGRGRVDERVFTAGRFRDFCDANADWLEPYVCYMALRDAVEAGEVPVDPGFVLDGDGAPVVGEDGEPVRRSLSSVMWQEWPERYRSFSTALLADPAVAPRADFHRFCQWLFQEQWMGLKAYANERGVALIGDMPMYVSEDSADTWAYPDVFNLGPDGRKVEGAGVPPDAFAPEGQLWGNPTYDWDRLADNGYDWWIERLRRAFELYDYVRLDHFVGFENYYSVPAGKKATEGRWLPGPGVALFERACAEFGPLPVIAEDLGTITPAIRGLVAQCGFPGMDVLEFFDGDLRRGYTPVPGKVAYTSTHDTDTLLGFVTSHFGITDENEAHTLAERIMAGALCSDTPVVMMPLQDVMGLGTEARMNVPGEAEGNWGWQATEDGVLSAEPLLRLLTEESGRA